jgi:hypothetical protein
LIATEELIRINQIIQIFPQKFMEPLTTTFHVSVYFSFSHLSNQDGMRRFSAEITPEVYNEIPLIRIRKANKDTAATNLNKFNSIIFS